MVLAGPPCAGKTTLAAHLAGPQDTVLDYDDLARALGSPALWRHPEPYRTMAEQTMQQHIHHAYLTPGYGTAWVLRTAPRAQQRASLARQWQATVYLLNPGERECKRRAKQDQRPSGTSRAVSDWYHYHRAWVGDRDPGELDPRWANPTQRILSVDPTIV